MLNTVRLPPVAVRIYKEPFWESIKWGMPNQIEDDAARRKRLLAVLPDTEFRRLKPSLTKVSLPLRQKVYEPNVPIQHVYFPLTGIISMLTVMKNGERSEVATVGNEGMIGIPVFLGAQSVPGEAFAQIPGDAIRIDSVAFLIHLKDEGALRAILNRYAQTLMDQLAQSVSCNRLHNIEQRCARWLL